MLLSSNIKSSETTGLIDLYGGLISENLISLCPKDKSEMKIRICVKITLFIRKCLVLLLPTSIHLQLCLSLLSNHSSSIRSTKVASYSSNKNSNHPLTLVSAPGNLATWFGGSIRLLGGSTKMENPDYTSRSNTSFNCGSTQSQWYTSSSFCFNASEEDFSPWTINTCLGAFSMWLNQSIISLWSA